MHTLLQIKKAMFGPPNSTVKLHMQDKAGNMYDVTAMRHLIQQRWRMSRTRSTSYLTAEGSAKDNAEPPAKAFSKSAGNVFEHRRRDQGASQGFDHFRSQVSIREQRASQGFDHEGFGHSPRHIMQETGVRLRLPFPHLIPPRSFMFSLPLAVLLTSASPPSLPSRFHLTRYPYHRLDLSRSKASCISAWRSRRAATECLLLPQTCWSLCGGTRVAAHRRAMLLTCR